MAGRRGEGGMGVCLLPLKKCKVSLIVLFACIVGCRGEAQLGGLVPVILQQVPLRY